MSPVEVSFSSNFKRKFKKYSKKEQLLILSLLIRKQLTLLILVVMKFTND